MDNFLKKLYSFAFIFLAVIFSISCIGNDNSSNNPFDDNFDNEPIEEQVVDFSCLTYCAIGDSITYGYTPYTDNVQMQTPYVKQVGNILDLKETYNLGISGSTLTNNWHGIARRLDTIPNADIISLFAGTNDWSHKHPLGTINDTEDNTVYGALNIICSYLKETHSQAFCFLITPYPRRGMNSSVFDYTLYDVRDCIFEIGKKYNMPVLNLLDNGHFQLEMNDIEISDGLHPTQNFVLEYTAPQIAKFIKDNYKK